MKLRVFWTHYMGLTGYILMAAKTHFFIKTVKIFTHDDVCEEPSH
jgi:hypothetical protein